MGAIGWVFNPSVGFCRQLPLHGGFFCREFWALCGFCEPELTRNCQNRFENCCRNFAFLLQSGAKCGILNKSKGKPHTLRDPGRMRCCCFFSAVWAQRREGGARYMVRIGAGAGRSSKAVLPDRSQGAGCRGLKKDEGAGVLPRSKGGRLLWKIWHIWCPLPAL